VIAQFARKISAALWDDVNDRHANIQAANLIKRKRQDRSAEKMMKMREKYTCGTGAAVGAVVRVGNDVRDVKNPRSTLGVILEVAEAGGALVCTEWGVLVCGTKRMPHWVASDRYEVVAKSDDSNAAVLSTDLQRVRDEIREGRFDMAAKHKVTLQECHKRFVGSSPIRATNGCKCGRNSQGRKSCTKMCGCIAKKMPCTSKCQCNGNCSANQFNHL
jgi:hypothetical protein